MKLSENVKFSRSSLLINEFQEKLPEILKYRYMIIYGMSRRIVASTEVVKASFHDWDEIVEFRCFDEYGEIHGVLCGEEMTLYEVTDHNVLSDVDETIIQQEYALGGAETGFGENETVYGIEHGLGNPKKLILRRYLEFDEDGQGHIALSRCFGFTV